MPPVSPIADLSSSPRQHVDGGARRALAWTSRHNTPLTIVAAGIVPILYLVFIDHFALNSFVDDDWSVVPLVHAALHDQLSLSLVWSQHNESRIVLGNLIDVLFGYADQLDVRAIVFLDAALFIASYIGLLALVRRYTSMLFTPIPVLVIGALWFSLADYQNELWAFQVSWYLTVFFFVMMLCALVLPERRRPLWFAAAVVLALAASLSTVQGFLCWPIGAICLLWPTLSRRRRPEIAIWLGAMLVTMGVYLHGYKFSEGDTCIDPVQCTARFELHRPQIVLEFFLALIGNVIPGTAPGHSLADSARFVVLGVALFAASVFILVQSWRHRASTEQLPLPGLLVLFALLFDATIVVGRGGTGVVGAIDYNRYTMANLILLTAVVIWTMARIPALRPLATSSRWRAVGSSVILAALTIFLVVQVTEATAFGVSNARNGSSVRIAYNRLYVNSYPSCVIVRRFPVFVVAEAELRDGAEDHLGEWGPTTYHYFRELGPTPDEITLAKNLSERVAPVSGGHWGPCFLPALAPSSG